jgi:molecular chaperone HtpG
MSLLSAAISVPVATIARISLMSDADTLPKEPVAEAHAFQAEVAELLGLMVHSVYSETDVFLRELISNASDACDRLRYEAIAKPELTAADNGPPSYFDIPFRPWL